MPNHVYSSLDIVCNESQVEEIKSLLLGEPNERDEQSDFDFNKIIPTPPEVSQESVSLSDREKNPLNWYDWNRENWGTKWNAYSIREPEVFKGSNSVDMMVDKESSDRTVVLRYNFQTAWSPVNDTIITKLSEMLPDNKIVYTAMCEGWNFIIQCKFINGDETILFDTGDVSEEMSEKYESFIENENVDVFNEVLSS